MSVTDLLDMQGQTVTISRQAPTTGNKTANQEIGTYQSIIEPMSDQAHIEFNLALGTGFHAYFDSDADIRKNDKLTDASGTSYAVTGLRQHGYGTNPFTRAYLVMETGR